MRVIAGEFRSRHLITLPGLEVRPTPDRLRETLFNILAPRIPGAKFVDAYAGTGAVGIEALSRGASHVWFLERHRAALDVIRQNVAALGLESRSTVVTGPALLSISRHPAELVFIDPPYNLEREYQAMLELLAGSPPGLTVVQHSVRLALQDAYGALQRTRLLRQGDNALSFYAARAVETIEPNP